jgi:chromosome segregation ATPase
VPHKQVPATVIAVIAVLAVGLALAVGLLIGRDDATTAPASTPVVDDTVAASPVTETPAPASAESLPTVDETASEADTATAIDDATAATEDQAADVTATTSSATDDGNVTADEAQTILIEVEDVDQYIAATVALVDYYATTYAGYAEMTIDELEAIEAGLAELEETNAQIEAELDDLNASIDTLEGYATELAGAAESAAAAAQAWVDSAATARDTRLAELQQIPADPTALPTDARGVTELATSYVADLEAALADRSIAADELEGLLADGAALSAGMAQLDAFAGLQSRLDALNAQLARGEVPQLSADLPGLTADLASFEPPAVVAPGR